jgi:4-oxalocrotonate tautomerase family enzyme
MPIIQCDIRRGRSDEQKYQLGMKLTEILQRYTGAPRDAVMVVFREIPGANFFEAGVQLPDYLAGPDGRDLAGEEELRRRPPAQK